MALPAKQRLNINNIIKYLLIILAYIFIVAIISNNFDFDLGWHLRFGKEFWASGKFSYVDTYTYSHYGELWVNHEWGGDLTVWPIYRYLGYNTLLLLFSLLPLGALIGAIKIFNRRLTAQGAAVTLFLLWSAQHVLIVRLHMFTPLFLVLLWHWLERFPNQKNYYWWPAFFWLWSFLHGSWILGFIVIGVYLGGNIINLLCEKYYRRYYRPNQWSLKEIKNVLIWTFISILATCLNPYGTGLWNEVLSYFTNNYYKLHTLEWLPSYYPPIYWLPLVIAFVTLPIVLFLFKKQKITWPQLLLYLAFWWAAWKYKRNSLLFLLICAPLITALIEHAKDYFIRNEIGRLIMDKTIKTVSVIFASTTTVLLIIYYSININFTGNVWNDQKIMDQAHLPLSAVKLLNQKITTHPARLFNDFAWGGFLNWQLPQDLVWLDGRGTATWKKDGISLLEFYQNINFQPNGLKIIEKEAAQFILLAKFIGTPAPEKINGLINYQSPKNSSARTRPLVEAIKNSPAWRLIYEDEISWLWEKK